MSVRRVLGALALLTVIVACGDDGAYVPAGMVRTPPPEVATVHLPDVTSGTDFVFRAGPEELLVVYWGYTSCPDICPTTMADLRRAVVDLGDDADRIDVAVVTVDPERDTPDVLTAYVRAFFPDGSAVRTEDPAVLAAAAEPFGAAYEVSTNDEGYVEVVHTAFLYAIDDRGLIRLTWPFGIESEDIHRDLVSLLEGYADA